MLARNVCPTDTPMTTLDTASYLRRLDLPAPASPTLDALSVLQTRHNAVVPFETLDSLLRQPVAIDLPSVQRKVLQAMRGGYCYELNGLFLALLETLGFDARAIAARVVEDDDRVPTSQTHLCSVVTLGTTAYLVDVGFGGNTPTAPLRLDRRDPQPTPHGRYRIDLDHDGVHTLLAEILDQWRPLYRFDLRPVPAIDREVGNWYVCTHPDSSFPGHLRVARAGPGWRRTIGNGRLTLHRPGQPSQHRSLVDADDVLAVLAEAFDIRPAPHPPLRDAIDTWLSAYR